MKTALRAAHLSLIILLSTALMACTNLDSSRNASNPDVPGKVLAAQVCSTCHGITGQSTSPMFPKLAGQTKEYLIAQLTDFKGHDRSDSRGTEYMWGFTHLTTSQVNELADYFSAQNPMSGRTDGTQALDRGKEIFQNGIPDKGVTQCVTCHGASGEGNATFPRLAGQHANYLIEQIKVFQQSEQRPRGAIMRQITHELTDADAAAVAYYLESIGATQ